jgi:hypothetical protein
MTNPKPDDGGEMKRAQRDGSSQSQPVFGSVPLPTREAEPSAARGPAPIPASAPYFPTLCSSTG